MSVNHTCQNCGQFLKELADVTAHACTAMSVADESMDTLIQQASVPNLATLFRRAKEAGVIGPVSVYGEGAPAS